MTASFPETDAPDIICLSHLRWNFVFQRPQHLMTRFGARHRVFFVEEPIWTAEPDHLVVRAAAPGVNVVTPHLHESSRSDRPRATAIQRRLLDELIAGEKIALYVLWYLTPMALPFTAHLQPLAVVYDCMDELSGFAGAPEGLAALEAELFRHADLITTGGRGLFEAKRHRHHNIHPFPSSIDAPLFRRARARLPDPEDQAAIPRPRLGYAGVIDERMDLELVDGLCRARPEWHVVLVGPIAKIDPAALPRHPNLHLLGMKPYEKLPEYLASWDVAILPFAHNDATRFISPTKTPEYLAAGRPVVSTSLRDVVRPYGEAGLARIADGTAAFIAAVAEALDDDRDALARAADAFLAGNSWDETAERMRRLMMNAVSDAGWDRGWEVACSTFSS